MITQLVVLLNYSYFNYYQIKLLLFSSIAIDLSEQHAPDADPKTTQKINFRGNFERERNYDSTMFFIIEEAKGTVLDFSRGPVKVL